LIFTNLIAGPPDAGNRAAPGYCRRRATGILGPDGPFHRGVLRLRPRDQRAHSPGIQLGRTVRAGDAAAAADRRRDRTMARVCAVADPIGSPLMPKLKLGPTYKANAQAKAWAYVQGDAWAYVRGDAWAYVRRDARARLPGDTRAHLPGDACAQASRIPQGYGGLPKPYAKAETRAYVRGRVR
jgi:hypothetical protein